MLTSNMIILVKNVDHGHTLEPPHLAGSNKRPRSMFRAKIRRTKHVYPYKPQFYDKNGVKISCKLHKLVSMMYRQKQN